MLLTYRKIGHGNVFMVKDANTEDKHTGWIHGLPLCPFIFYGLKLKLPGIP